MFERLRQTRATLGSDVATSSPLRKVSLNRLERALADQAKNDRRPTDEMLRLAGLTRIQYVFCYPETGDVIIAGPAEVWVSDLSGRTIGIKTGQPILQLEDLAAMLRAYEPGGSAATVIGCSIDPTPEGLARMQDFLRRRGGYATPRDTQFIVEGLRTNLGLQTVSIMGVAPDTHVAQVLVEADYRMKLIAIGLEPTVVKMTTFIDRATSAVARNALIRWYFVPDYRRVRTTEDGLGMELVGTGVKLVDENEVVAADGSRSGAVGNKNGASLAFTTSFTQKYAEIAAAKPVYAQLRNVIDLAVVAAYLQKYDFYGQTGWKADLLRDEARLPIHVHPVPHQVDTVVTSVWKGNQLLTPVAGGVTIQAEKALKSDNLLPDERGRTEQARKDVSLRSLNANQWWWD